MQQCKKCGKFKILTDFPQAGKYKGKQKYKKTCKICDYPRKRVYEKQYRDKNRDKIREYSRKSRKKYLISRTQEQIKYDRQYQANRSAKIRFINKQWIDNIKLSIGCIICGYNKYANSLHFHHINPENKSFGIAKAASQGASKEVLILEIKKCIILCANCHGEVEGNFTKLIMKEIKYNFDLQSSTYN